MTNIKTFFNKPQDKVRISTMSCHKNKTQQKKLAALSTENMYVCALKDHLPNVVSKDAFF